MLNDVAPAVSGRRSAVASAANVGRERSEAAQAEALRRVERWLEAEGRRRLAWDQAGRLAGVDEPGSGRAAYGYDERGDLASITEPGGAATSYRYDALRRLASVLRPDGRATSYRYADDRLCAIDDCGVVTQFSYDELGRLRSLRAGGCDAAVFRYDAAGRVAEARAGAVTTSYRYDQAGRVVGIAQSVDGVTLEVALRYDAAGRLDELRLPGEPRPLRYSWDDAGRPEAVALGATTLAHFAYEPETLATRVRFGNGLEEVCRADPADRRPLERALRAGQDVLFSRSYSYTPEGRVGDDGARQYRYDEAGRLVEAHEQRAGGAAQYRYGWGETADVDAGLRYDDRGRLVEKRGPEGATVFRYDDAGRLVAVLRAGLPVARYRYDHKGRLVLAARAGDVERYVYGPADELLAVADAEGRPLRLYVRTPLGPLAELRGERVIYRHHDERGTCQFATDERGAVIERFRYDPFGLPEGAPPDLRPIFDGREWDAEAGLYYFGARWYDPALRRFLTPDSYTGAPDDARLVHPLGPASGQAAARAQILGEWLRRPLVRDPYAYCAGDPINNSDPNGHWSFGGVLLSVLGAIWTLPNTLFGLVLEITCLVGEVIRWLVWLVSAGNVSWETPGFDAAASGRLNAFALVFTGGWLGSFSSLLGITFGNVFFVYKNWEQDPGVNPPGDVFPTAYDGKVAVPGSEALYEHELRHTNQYGWFGPFFHLGLPIFGFYLWDVILHGYHDAWTERDARAHGGV